MARAYVKIYCNGEVMRTYGGNKPDVRWMKRHYENITLERFLEKHKHLTEEDYKGLSVSQVHINR